MSSTVDSSTVDEVLAAVVERGDLLGVVATAGTMDGPLYEGSAGLRSNGGTEEMAPDTVLWIASMTKPVTGTAVMQLVEQGKLSLDEPAREVLPELAEAQVLDGFDPAGDPILRAPRAGITLRHLLTHTSGYGYDVWNENLRRYQRENPDGPTPLLFDPGAQWMYGTGIDHAGRMVEAVSGHRLGRYLEANVFEPLGMVSTAFGVPDDRLARVADLHRREPDGSFAVSHFHSPAQPEVDAGGGGLHSTVTDYLRFGRAFLNAGELDGVRILRPETVASMATNHLGGLNVTTLEPAIRSLSNPANFFPGMVQKWGLSFLINTEATAEGRSAGSLTWGGLANSYFWIDPTAGVCGVWATQLLPFADPVALDNFRSFERSIYDLVGP